MIFDDVFVALLSMLVSALQSYSAFPYISRKTVYLLFALYYCSPCILSQFYFNNNHEITQSWTINNYENMCPLHLLVSYKNNPVFYVVLMPDYRTCKKLLLTVYCQYENRICLSHFLTEMK